MDHLWLLVLLNDVEWWVFFGTGGGFDGSGESFSVGRGGTGWNESNKILTKYNYYYIFDESKQ